MPQLIIKYKNAKALKALQDLTKLLDITIEKPVKKNTPTGERNPGGLPITFAKNPDIKALAGIWEGKDIALEELRKEAWGCC